MKKYNSPRWSGEILDCSMPMTFDTYNKCSYNCLYCFSFFQKSHSQVSGGTGNRQDPRMYQQSDLAAVDPKKIETLFKLESKNELKQFIPYITQRRVMQWGGLADQFDEYERRNGVTLELMKILKGHDYPLSFSTKATWWIYDERYRALVKGQDNWHIKFSIINLDKDRSRRMEKGVDSPQERLNAIKEYSSLNKAGVTLRLRPFIIGFTDRNDEYIELIEQAAKAGVDSVTTEFFCLEARADKHLRRRYANMSEIIGYDIWDFYRSQSKGAGYMRLNYSIKKPYIEKMRAACKKLGLRFYVSDAHHKEKCDGGSCCGLRTDYNYSRGQFTEAILIAREKGEVHYSDISKDVEALHGYRWYRAVGFNTTGWKEETKRRNQLMKDYIREMWNNPNNSRSPYRYFGGVLKPATVLDANGDVVYLFDYKKANLKKPE